MLWHLHASLLFVKCIITLNSFQTHQILKNMRKEFSFLAVFFHSIEVYLSGPEYVIWAWHLTDRGVDPSASCHWWVTTAWRQPWTPISDKLIGPHNAILCTQLVYVAKHIDARKKGAVKCYQHVWEAIRNVMSKEWLCHHYDNFLWGNCKKCQFYF